MYEWSKPKVSTIHSNSVSLSRTCSATRTLLPGQLLSLLDEMNNNFIGPLLAFKTSIERLTVEVDSKLKCPLPNRMGTKAYFRSLPPRNDSSFSRISVFETSDSNEVFDSDNNNNKSEHADKSYDQLDEFCFVKRGEQWFNVNIEDNWDSRSFVD